MILSSKRNQLRVKTQLRINITSLVTMEIDILANNNFLSSCKVHNIEQFLVTDLRKSIDLKATNTIIEFLYFYFFQLIK